MNRRRVPVCRYACIALGLRRRGRIKVIGGDAAARAQAECAIGHHRRVFKHDDRSNRVIYVYVLYRERRIGERIETPLRKGTLEAGLGGLKSVFIVLVVSRHGQFSGRRIQAGNGQYGDDNQQDQPDNERGTVLSRTGTQRTFCTRSCPIPTAAISYHRQRPRTLP